MTSTNLQTCRMLRYRVKNGSPDVLTIAAPDYEACAITSIERRFKVKTSETPIITKRAENRYIIDMGVTETIYIHVTRCEPPASNDSGTDQRYWSNAKWMREVHEFFDGWQNLNYDSNGDLAGGFTLEWRPGVEEHGETTVLGTLSGDAATLLGEYVQSDGSARLTRPASDDDMFPPMALNVFVSNNLDFTYGYYTKLTLSLTVGTLKPSVDSDIGSLVKFQYGESNSGQQ